MTREQEVDNHMASNGISNHNDTRPKEKVIVIGDVHGYVDKLKSLWKLLEKELGKELDEYLVVFLGDLVDRGPHSKKTIDWLIDLKEKRKGKTVCLCGNHDFGLITFLGLIGKDMDLSDTWRDTDEVLYIGPGFERMHFQGRRWGAGQPRALWGSWGSDSIYDSKSTFKSYGVQFGDRTAFVKSLPDSHREFFSNLPWVHETEGYIFVHAGLQEDNIEDQLRVLRERQLISRPIGLCERATVRRAPSGLDKVVVSGHHCDIVVSKKRVIWDPSGGMPSEPLGALILTGSAKALGLFSNGQRKQYTI